MKFSLVVILAIPCALGAQVHIALGTGFGIAGGTDASLTNGRKAPVLMGEIATATPLVRVGAEVDYWRRTAANLSVATGLVEFHLPLLAVFAKVGAGYGSGDIGDGRGKVSGTAGQIGAGYTLGVPLIPVGLQVFGNGYLIHGSARNVQMLDAGIAVTWQ